MFAYESAGTEGASAVEEACAEEARRQWESLILIPSESICLPQAREALASPFSHVYAEGRPEVPLCHDPRGYATDAEVFQAWRRRLADGRYYKGTSGADVVELLAQRFIAQAWAALEDSPPAEEIAAAVQALSGAAANLAVETALLKQGDTLMGLDLSHGGHLTHGSEFNFSGKSYRVVSYGIDPDTRKLDYEAIRTLAREHRPRLIIGGASSYPYDFDWAELRAIADEVGAYLLADVAHLAGMVVAGLLSNPLPHAHVVTFTTHKTLMGPRGAVILTTDRELGQTFAQAVFPGIQGGPHLQSIAAIARLFEVINERRNEFVEVQQAILDNTACLADCLRAEGFALEYGGTDTHMLLVDLKPFPVEGDPEVPLDGEIASRLLELVGIVVNKNVLPGDPTAGQASGLRMGMPWLTQRGVTREHIRELAAIVKSILGQVHTCAVWVPGGKQRCRGRIPAEVLEEARRRVRAIVEELPYPPRPQAGGSGPLSVVAPAVTVIGGRRALLLRGEKVGLALEELLTCRTLGHASAQELVHGLLLRSDASIIDDVLVAPLGSKGREERWLLLTNEHRAEEVRSWLEGLSDGYLLFDTSDLQAKVEGPALVEDAPAELLSDELLQAVEAVQPVAAKNAADAYREHPQLFGLAKPYFVGQRTLIGELAEQERPSALPSYQYRPPELPVRRTVLYDLHRQSGAKMAQFAGWEMPLEYPAGTFAEHRAVRSAGGLFDVSHMSLFEVAGSDALAFLEGALANCVSRLDPGEAQYTCTLDPDGVALDDLFLYRLQRDRFVIVSNAANAERVLDWLGALRSGSVLIDPDLPGKLLPGDVKLRSLREAGDDSLVGMALQGPASSGVLGRLCGGAEDRPRLSRLAPNRITRATVVGVPALIARTGYTGELMGFELYVHPDRAVEVWRAILAEGEPVGVLPAGLAARDSARVEAGLPLFGHELEGECGLTLTEAGYGFIVRFHVPFFVGRQPYMERAGRSRRHLLRLRGRGRRSVRPGHVIVDGQGRPVGAVTSFSFLTDGFDFVALAWVEEGFQPEPGTQVDAVRVRQGLYSAPARPELVVPLAVLTRFPEEEERQQWAQKYL